MRRRRTVGWSASGWASVPWWAIAPSNAGKTISYRPSSSRSRGPRAAHRTPGPSLRGAPCPARAGFAHFAHTSPKRTDLLGTEPRLMAPSHLEFVDGLRGDPGRQDAVDAAQDVVVTLETPHTLFDGQSRALGLGEGTKAGQGRQISIRLVASCERALRGRIDGHTHGFADVPDR